MAETNRAFRDYATRVSFSLNMSRNQVSTLRSMVLDIECAEQNGYRPDNMPGTEDRKRTYLQTGSPDQFVIGARWLQSAGLVKWTDPIAMNPKWSREPWELTEAGKHVVALLRIAGLIPERVANTNPRPETQAKRRVRT